MWKILLISKIIQNITTKGYPLDAVKKNMVNWHLQNNAKKKTRNTLRLMKVIWLELILKRYI